MIEKKRTFKEVLKNTKENNSMNENNTIDEILNILLGLRILV